MARGKHCSLLVSIEIKDARVKAWVQTPTRVRAAVCADESSACTGCGPVIHIVGGTSVCVNLRNYFFQVGMCNIMFHHRTEQKYTHGKAVVDETYQCLFSDPHNCKPPTLFLGTTKSSWHNRTPGSFPPHTSFSPSALNTDTLSGNSSSVFQALTIDWLF